MGWDHVCILDRPSDNVERVAWAVEEKKKWVDSKYGWLGHLINAEGAWGKGGDRGVKVYFLVSAVCS